MTMLSICRVDGRLVIELPETLALQAQLREGDVLEAIDVRVGGFSVNAVSDAQARQTRLGHAIMEQYAETHEVLAAAEQVMAEHEQVLRELAR